MLEYLFSVLNFVFYPLTLVKPVFALFIISAFITIAITLINRLLVNQKLVKDLKNRMETIRENLSKAQKSGESEKASKLLNEMLTINNQYMGQMFKALSVSIIVVLLFLPWMQFKYSNAPVARLPLAVPYIGSEMNWVVWYLIVSLAIGWVIRKLMGMDYA